MHRACVVEMCFKYNIVLGGTEGMPHSTVTGPCRRRTLLVPTPELHQKLVQSAFEVKSVVIASPFMHTGRSDISIIFGLKR